MTKLLLLLCLCLIGGPQLGVLEPAQSSGVQDVEFCDVLANPEAFDQKLVRTRAIFRYGGEDTTDLYCPDCSGPDWGWVKPFFGDSYESCTKKEVAKKLSRHEHDGGTVRVTLVGKFFAGKKGEKSYQLQIQCVEEADYITREYKFPEALPPKIRKRVRC